jgi:uncharacterized integral membrane protein
MLEKKKQTFNDFWKSLTIIHFAMAAGQLLFLFVVIFLFLNVDPAELNPELKSALLIPAILVSFGGIIAGHFLYIKRIRQISTELSLKEKLDSYKNATIVRLALIEGPCLFAIVSLFMTGEHVFTGIAILLIAIFIYYRPTKLKLSNEIRLNEDDRKKINDPYIYL